MNSWRLNDAPNELPPGFTSPGRNSNTRIGRTLLAVARCTVGKAEALMRSMTSSLIGSTTVKNWPTLASGAWGCWARAVKGTIARPIATRATRRRHTESDRIIRGRTPCGVSRVLPGRRPLHQADGGLWDHRPRGAERRTGAP